MGQLAAYRHEGFWQCMDTVRDRSYLKSSGIRVRRHARAGKLIRLSKSCLSARERKR